MTAANPAGPDPRIDAVRGDMKEARLNGRIAAALGANPGCARRTLTDLARVPKETLSEAAGVPAPYGQSPFAITRGNAFENRLKHGSNYDLLYQVLTSAIGLPEDRYTVDDLGTDAIGPAAIRTRAYRTQLALQGILAGAANAAAVLDHPILTLQIAGVTVYVEPDALALAMVGGVLVPVEIKSFPSIDGIIDPEKAAAAARQVAVYLYALRQAVNQLGYPPQAVSTDAVLILPQNTTTQRAAGYPLPVGDRLVAFERQLARVTHVTDILDNLPPGFTLDPKDPALANHTDTQRETALAARLRMVPANYMPSCRSECGLGEFCHRQALDTGNPTLLGPSIRQDLAGITDLRQTPRIAAGQPQPADTAEPETASALRRAARIRRDAIEEATRWNGAA